MLGIHYVKIPADSSCLSFYSYRWLPVANMTIQNSVRLYEYYEPGNVEY